MINELLGIQFNVEKAKIDGKVQNLASYINEDTLIASHKEMDRKKAKGIDGVAKEDYSVDLVANVQHLVKRMKSGSYKCYETRRITATETSKTSAKLYQKVCIKKHKIFCSC